VAALSSTGDTSSWRITTYSPGFGVDRNSGDDDLVDGSGNDDYLRLTFSSSVTLVGAVFGYTNDSNDEVDVTRVLPSSGTLFSGSLTSTPTTTLSFSTNNAGTQFEFATTYFQSEWTLNSVTFNSPLVIPEPGTIALVGAGLIGLALWRRRRHAG
jgi:hypothetical protein